MSLTASALGSLLRTMKRSATGKAALPLDESDAEEEDAIDNDGGEEDSVATRRNAFKMLAFLLAEVSLASAGLDTEAASKAEKPQRGKAKSGDASGNRLHVCLERALAALLAGVDSDFARLWSLGVPEEVHTHTRMFL